MKTRFEKDYVRQKDRRGDLMNARDKNFPGRGQ